MESPGSPGASERAQHLARRLEEAASRLIAVIQSVDREQWLALPGPGVWAIGKEAEHVAEAGAFHQWIVRMTIGERVGSRRPPIERESMMSAMTPVEVVEQIRRRTDEGAQLIRGLSDAQLDLETRPPRARGERLAQTIERVLIGHYDAHRAGIEGKLAPARP